MLHPAGPQRSEGRPKPVFLSREEGAGAAKPGKKIGDAVAARTGAPDPPATRSDQGGSCQRWTKHGQLGDRDRVAF